MNSNSRASEEARLFRFGLKMEDFLQTNHRDPEALMAQINPAFARKNNTRFGNLLVGDHASG
jgi:hypothetical protein